MGEKRLIVAPAVWRPEHAALLERALTDPMETTETLRREVSAERAVLLEVTDAATGELVGAAVLRIEERELGREGVIAATGGARGCGARLLDLLPHLERRLVAEGCIALRVHPTRPGMLRFCLAQGYQPREWVLGKLVNGRAQI